MLICSLTSGLLSRRGGRREQTAFAGWPGQLFVKVGDTIAVRVSTTRVGLIDVPIEVVVDSVTADVLDPQPLWHTLGTQRIGNECGLLSQIVPVIIGISIARVTKPIGIHVRLVLVWYQRTVIDGVDCSVVVVVIVVDVIDFIIVGIKGVIVSLVNYIVTIDIVIACIAGFCGRRKKP